MPRQHPHRSVCFFLPAVLIGLAGCSSPPAAEPGAPVLLVAGQPAAIPVAIVDGKETTPPTIPMGDPAITRAILREGKSRNQVMDHLEHLTLRIGSRLTGSARHEQAELWLLSRYADFGFLPAEARREPWGDVRTRFERGPSTIRVIGQARPRPDRAPRPRPEAAAPASGGEPAPETPAPSPPAAPPAREEILRELQVSALAWSAGTPGPVRGPVIRMPETEEQYLAIRPSLKGAWVLTKAGPAVGQRGVRSKLGAAYEDRSALRAEVAAGKPVDEIPWAQRVAFDGVAGFLTTSRDERVWTGAAPGWRRRPAAEIDPTPHAMIRLSDYDFLNSRLADGEPVEVEVNLVHAVEDGPFPVHNVVAEIRGAVRPDEYVIVSGHLDSWDTPGSQGCTDNGTGTAVTLEAARILKAVGARPDRTILFIHWSGEEQGLLGSAAWVAANKERLPGISAVFVDDGGTNFSGGLPAADDMIPMLAAATAPINNVFYCDVDRKHLNINIRSTGPRLRASGGSDHASFNAVGVPGFFWDEVGRADYAFGWHTQNDRLDLAIPVYLRQSSTAAALVAYRLACAPTLLPRGEPAPRRDAPPAPS